MISFESISCCIAFVNFKQPKMLQLLCRSILGSVRMKVQNLPSKVTNVRHFCNARGEQFIKPRRLLLVNTNVSNISRVLKREMSSKPSFKPSMKLQRLQASDGIPSRYELIYRTDVGNYFLGFQVLVFSGLAAICVVIGLNLFAKYGGTAEGSEEVRAPSIPLFDAVKPSESQAAPLQPSTDDLWEEDLETAFLILGVTLCMAFCTYRLLRQFPVRIYSAPSVSKQSGLYGGELPYHVQ